MQFNADTFGKTARIIAIGLGFYHIVTLAQGLAGFLASRPFKPNLSKLSEAPGMAAGYAEYVIEPVTTMNTSLMYGAIITLVLHKIIWLLAAKWLYRCSDDLGQKAEAIDGDVKHRLASRAR